LSAPSVRDREWYSLRDKHRSMPRFLRFLVRDVAIGATTGAAWALDAHAKGSGLGGAKRAAIAIGAGLLTASVGFLMHEWGHLAGAIAAGGVVEEPASLGSPFLFFFNVEASDRRAFLAMSYGGYAGTAIATFAILRLVPRDTPAGRIALAATALGVAATLALEVPTTIRVARGGPLPTVGGVYAGTASQ